MTTSGTVGVAVSETFATSWTTLGRFSTVSESLDFQSVCCPDGALPSPAWHDREVFGGGMTMEAARRTSKQRSIKTSNCQ